MIFFHLFLTALSSFFCVQIDWVYTLDSFNENPPRFEYFNKLNEWSFIVQYLSRIQFLITLCHIQFFAPNSFEWNSLVKVVKYIYIPSSLLKTVHRIQLKHINKYERRNEVCMETNRKSQKWSENCSKNHKHIAL